MPETVRYLKGDFGDPDLYRRLRQILEEIESQRQGHRNRIFYLATPPEADEEIVRLLGEHKLAEPEDGWARVVVEKPFGHDLESARKLNECLRRVFDERRSTGSTLPRQGDVSERLFCVRERTL